MKLHIDKLGKVSITVEEDFWSELKAYDRLTIVGHSNGIAYISRCLVPRGTSIDNRAYWIPMGVVNAPIQANDYSILDSENDLPLTEGTYEGPYLIGNYGYFWVGANGNVEGKPQYKKIQLAGTPGKSAYESYKEYMIQSGKGYLDESTWSAMFAAIIDAGISSVQVINAFNSNSQIAASSANTVRVLKKNIELLFSNLADIAFKNGKSAISLDWEGKDSDEPVVNYYSIQYYGDVVVKHNGNPLYNGQTFAQGQITLTIEPQENSRITSVKINNVDMEINPDENGIVTLIITLIDDIVLTIGTVPIVTPITYNISVDESIDNLTVSALENHGNTLIARLTVPQHYNFPEEITCEMGETEFTLSEDDSIYGSYNNETGVITFISNNITDNIVITSAEVSEEPHYNVTLDPEFVSGDVEIKVTYINNGSVEEATYHQNDSFTMYDGFTMEINALPGLKFVNPPTVCVGTTCVNAAQSSQNGIYGPYRYTFADPTSTTFITVEITDQDLEPKDGPYSIALTGINPQSYRITGLLTGYLENDRVSFKIEPIDSRFLLSVDSVTDSNDTAVAYTFENNEFTIDAIFDDITIEFIETEVGTVDISLDLGEASSLADLGLAMTLNGATMQLTNSVNLNSAVTIQIIPSETGIFSYGDTEQGRVRILSKNKGVYHIDTITVCTIYNNIENDITNSVFDIDSNTIYIPTINKNVKIKGIKTSIWSHDDLYYNGDIAGNAWYESGNRVNGCCTLIPIPEGTTKIYVKNGGDVNLATGNAKKMSTILLEADSQTEVDNTYLIRNQQLWNNEKTWDIATYPNAKYVAVSSRVLDTLANNNDQYTSGIKNAYIKFEGVNPDTNTPFKIWGIKGFDVNDIQYNFHDNS